ncbi:MAG: glycosyltransferase [Planctomycetes bacterium]|nr:glycosyltransferase [Planctomycetota bacterium]
MNITAAIGDQRSAALVILARAPELGLVKTRLAADLGAERTLAVYRHLLTMVADLAAQWSGPVTLETTGAESAWLGSGLEHLPRRVQPAGGLGTRIRAGLEHGLQLAPHAVIIGTDCPALRLSHLHDVAAGLQTQAVAFGPAEDGGYWSVGVSTAAVIPLVTAEELPWSETSLLAVSRQRLAAAGIGYYLGPTLADCDTVTDLQQAIAAGVLHAIPD